jgi:DNA-binding response OmpR family regulator
MNLWMPAPCRDPMDGRDAAASLAGLRILVVEDEALLALDLEEGLLAAGCEVVGPAGTLSQGIRLAGNGPIDAAILDVNLAGEPVFPLARQIAENAPLALAAPADYIT